MGTFAEGLVGVVLDGRYRLDAVLGEGGMGSVFRAHHLAMDRKVAVKLLKPHLTSDATALDRFTAEARRTMRVDSPHAVKVLDFGVTEGRDYYMVLEYLDGRTVQRELEVDGPFAPARVLHIARHALAALGAAHAIGLVHRDIKPDNLLLMRSGDDPDYTKVLDFGVAKLMEGAQASAQSKFALTQQGMVFGTPEFMSPEQACGLPIDGRSDLYSLAATLFAMLTGYGLFSGKSPIEWLAHHARTPPPHLGAVAPELAPLVELDGLLQRCLAKRREQRPATAAEMEALVAGVERSLARSAAPMTPSRAVQAFSSATFVHLIEPPRADSIPPGLVEAPVGGPPLPPPEAPASSMSGMVRPPHAPTLVADALDDVPARSPRRGLYLGLGLVAVVGVIAIAVVLAATRGKPDAAAPVAAKPAPLDAAVVAAVAAGDAAPTPAPADAATPADAAAPPIDASAPIDAAVAHPKPPATPPPAGNHQDVLAHIAAAKDARDAGNRLKELGEADAALKIESGNLEALFLEADALIVGYHEIDRGCRILKSIKRYPLATARMRVAGCPD